MCDRFYFFWEIYRPQISSAQVLVCVVGACMCVICFALANFKAKSTAYNVFLCCQYIYFVFIFGYFVLATVCCSIVFFALVVYRFFSVLGFLGFDSKYVYCMNFSAFHVVKLRRKNENCFVCVVTFFGCRFCFSSIFGVKVNNVECTSLY